MTINKLFHLTFDIEEYFQVENLRSVFPPSGWDNQVSTVERNISRILEILDTFNVKATFFFLGVVAKKVPRLVKDVASAGHEVASHGYGHMLTNTLTDKELYDDLQSAKNILENLISKEVVGYRAPSFSINDRLLHYLKDIGYVYDSSYNPFRLNSRYGAFTIPIQQEQNGYSVLENNLIEVPLGFTPFLGQTVPSGGGAYFRIFPYPLYQMLLGKALHRLQQFTFYLHPWEFEPEQQKITEISLFYQFRHYHGLKYTSSKLKKMITYLKKKRVKMIPVKDGLEQVGLIGRNN